MTTRLDARFGELAGQNRAALVTFITAGDPDPATSAAILEALPQAGADVIEIGRQLPASISGQLVPATW